jgi:hypothetical protein
MCSLMCSSGYDNCFFPTDLRQHLGLKAQPQRVRELETSCLELKLLNILKARLAAPQKQRCAVKDSLVDDTHWIIVAVTVWWW